MYKQLFYQISRFLFIVVVLLCFTFFLTYAFAYIYPILLALVFSFALNPAVTFLERTLKFPRGIATIALIIILFAAIISSIILIVSEFIQGTTYLAEIIPAHFNTLITYAEEFLETHIIPFYHKLMSFFHTLDPDKQETIHEHLQHMANQIASSGTTLLQTILLKIPAAISMLPTSFAVFIFIVLATFFITKDWYALQETFAKAIPSSATDSRKHIWNHLKRALLGFFKAQIVLISITGLLIFIGLHIIGIDHALTIALIASVVDLFPYVGTGIIFIPWIIYLFLTANYPLTISLSILYMVITISRQLLEPKLLSSSIGVNPLAVLIAVFLGMQFWGVFGLIIAPILLVLLNALHQSGVFQQLWRFIKG